jgi:hypothetical protein
MKAAKPLRLYTGHGPPLEDGEGVIGDYIKHRMVRVQQCKTLVKEAGEAKSWTAESVTRAIYVDTPEHLIRPAMGNTILVLQKLARDGILRNDGGPLKGTWHYVADGRATL